MGLLQNAGAPTGQEPAQAAAPNPEKYEESSEGGNVSPEEQAEYDQFMDNAASLMFVEGGESGHEVQPSILEALQAPPADEGGNVNPKILALANAAVTIVTGLDDSARAAGKPVSDDVLMHGAEEIIEQLGEIAETAGIAEYTPEDLTGAFQQAIDMYRPKLIQDGRTDEETLKGQFNEINQAEANGQLGEMLPGLGAPAEQGPM